MGDEDPNFNPVVGDQVWCVLTDLEILRIKDVQRAKSNALLTIFCLFWFTS